MCEQTQGVGAALEFVSGLGKMTFLYKIKAQYKNYVSALESQVSGFRNFLAGCFYRVCTPEVLGGAPCAEG